MATIYRRVGGRKLTGLIARLPEVQLALDEVVLEGALKAEAKLTEHKLTGDSRIRIEHGSVDRFLVLDDSRGLDAAMSIEFGRKLKGGGRTTPVRALHSAFGLGE